ncbi:hypothetical protein D3C79_871190 [compost metagenome]
MPLVLLLLASLLCLCTPFSRTCSRLGRLHLPLGESELPVITGIRQLIAPLAVLPIAFIALIRHLLPLLLVLPHGISQAH